VETHWLEIQALASELEKHETLHEDEAEIIVDIAGDRATAHDLAVFRALMAAVERARDE
jgi:hypothetical protein